MNKKFIDEVLEASNIYRKRHKVEPLKLNPKLSEIAQKWANHLLKLGTMEHSTNKYKGVELGENISIKESDKKTRYSGYNAVDQWYQEIKDFCFKFYKGSNTGHFTQLIWKDSKEMGVGLAKSKKGKNICVVNYYPPGNIEEEYEKNIFPPINGDKSLIYFDDPKHVHEKNLGEGTRTHVKTQIKDGWKITTTTTTVTKNGVTETTTEVEKETI